MRRAQVTCDKAMIPRLADKGSHGCGTRKPDKARINSGSFELHCLFTLLFLHQSLFWFPIPIREVFEETSWNEVSAQRIFY